jgi:hypothetical protein
MIMDRYDDTIKRRDILIKIIQENVEEMGYSNCPIGYFGDNTHMQTVMKEDILRNIGKIEKALKLIKTSI